MLRLRTFVLAAETFAPARASWRPEHGLAPPSLERSPRPVWPKSRVERDRGPPFSPRELPAVADTEEAHREAIARGLEHDLLVTSGGVSVGPHDLVRRIEAELGVEEVFWRVAVKPGKPVSFGVRGSTLVFGLPGNPVSSLVGFELFVRPAVVALQGASEPLPRFEPGKLGSDVRVNPNRDELVRARTRNGAEGAVVLDPLSGQESHMIARASGADALVLLPRGEGELAAGASVRYLRLG